MEYENRTLAVFIKAKLGINLERFAELEGVSVNTLKSRWKAEFGRRSIYDAVLRRYIEEFHDL